MQAKELPSLEERVAKFEARRRKRNEVIKVCHARAKAKKNKPKDNQTLDETTRQARLIRKRELNKLSRERIKARSAEGYVAPPPMVKIEPEEQFIPCKGLAYMNIDRDRAESPPRMTLGEAARFLDIDPSKLLLDSLNGIAPQPMPNRDKLIVEYLKSDIEKYKQEML